VGFVVDKMALGTFISEYFGFLLPITVSPTVHVHLSSGSGAVGPFEIAVQMNSVSPQSQTKIKKSAFGNFAFLKVYIE
jgi:hypothetical protein